MCIVLFIICVGMENFFIYLSAKAPSGLPVLHSCCVKSAGVVVVVGSSTENIPSSSIWGLASSLNGPSVVEETLRNVARSSKPLVDAGRHSDYVSTLFAKASVWLLLACLNVCVWIKRPNLNNRPTLKTKARALSWNSTHLNFLPVPRGLFMRSAHY